jgi:maleate cis-trans isomerase
VIEAMHTLKLRSLAMATPFRPFVNDRLARYLASEQITVTYDNALGIEHNTEIRRLPVSVEYNLARRTYLECENRPDGIYIPCDGWGSIRNIALLERDLDTTVVT